MSYLKVSLLFLFLAGCGFSAIYSKKNESYIKENLSKISVSTIKGQLGSKLKNNLEDKLGQADPKYLLEVDLLSNNEALTIEKSSFVTHYTTNITASLKLKTLITNEVIYEKSIKNTTDYNATDKLFANYIAEEDSLDNNIIQMSELILKDLTFFFMKNSK